MWQVDFEKKKIRYFLFRNFRLPCTIQEYHNVTTFICPRSFKFLALKVVVVVYERWSPTGGSIKLQFPESAKKSNKELKRTIQIYIKRYDK